MRQRRKSLAVREDAVKRITEAAKKRGATISSYLIELFTSAAEVEEAGLYAPRVLMEQKLLSRLAPFTPVLVPLEALFSCKYEVEKWRKVGERIGRALRALNIDTGEVAEVLAKNIPWISKEGARMVVTPNADDEAAQAISELITGLATEGGLEAVRYGDITVINFKAEAPRQRVAKLK